VLIDVAYENINFDRYPLDKFGYTTIRLYHGCDKPYNEINFKEFRITTDFGQGFYTTVLEEQAAYWAYKKHLKNRNNTVSILYTFILRVKIVNNTITGLKVKKYDKMDKACLDEITNNRLRFFLEKRKISIPIDRDIDCIIGAMADGNNMIDILTIYHNAGRINPDKYINLLGFKKRNGEIQYTNQIVFRTYKALSMLKAISIHSIQKKESKIITIPYIGGEKYLFKLNTQFMRLRKE
jgi:hypothetical protein